MEARIARIESDVAHLRTDVADIKVDLRSLRDKVDSVEATSRGEIKDVHTSLLEKLDSLKDGQASLKAEIASAKIWALFLYITLAGMMLTVMARGFRWM